MGGRARGGGGEKISAPHARSSIKVCPAAQGCNGHASAGTTERDRSSNCSCRAPKFRHKCINIEGRLATCSFCLIAVQRCATTRRQGYAGASLQVVVALRLSHSPPCEMPAPGLNLAGRRRRSVSDPSSRRASLVLAMLAFLAGGSDGLYRVQAHDFGPKQTVTAAGLSRPIERPAAQVHCRFKADVDGRRRSQIVNVGARHAPTYGRKAFLLHTRAGTSSERYQPCKRRSSSSLAPSRTRSIWW